MTKGLQPPGRAEQGESLRKRSPSVKGEVEFERQLSDEFLRRPLSVEPDIEPLMPRNVAESPPASQSWAEKGGCRAERII